MSIKKSPALPPELWRHIFTCCTNESALPFFRDGPPSFGWPYHPTFDAAFLRSLATRRSLVLVSRCFYEIASRLLYETLHFRSVRQAMTLAEQCKVNLKVASGLRSWARALCITPVFTPVTTERELKEVEDFLRSVLEITQLCSNLRTAFIQVDTITLFHKPTYQPWVKTLNALPSNIEHLAAEDFLLGPVIWKPRLFSSWDATSSLRKIRLDAVHEPFEHHFPHLTHLSLFSWPTASKWDMPSLRNLYIEYFPGNSSTTSFWNLDRDQLKLLHFGTDTDFGLHHPDLPQQLQDTTPNLEVLEYHISGDFDIRWDPAQLPRRLESITIKWEDAEPNNSGPSSTPEDISLRFPAAGFIIQKEQLTQLCPSASNRWVRVERHLEKLTRQPAEVFVLFPKRAASVVHLDISPHFL